MSLKKRTKKLSNTDRKLIEEIIRVDHAGEHGATQIYRGQLKIFNKDTPFGKEIRANNSATYPLDVKEIKKMRRYLNIGLL